MHGSDDEYAERDLMRDSSQTLPNDDFHPGIDEEEMLNYQLPKQVHASDIAPKDSGDHEEQINEIRSYKSMNDHAQKAIFSSKNMKDSFETKFENKFESKSMARAFGQDKDAIRSSMVKSPEELASKYEQRLGDHSNIMHFSEKNTKMSSQNAHTEFKMGQMNDLQISRIEMIGESASQTGTNNLRRSIQDSNLCDIDMNKDIDLLRSRSRSIPRRNDLLSNMQFVDKAGSPLVNDNLIMDDDEILDRIRLQGERLIKQPEIMNSQPHKQLERAMKGQKENAAGSIGRQYNDTAINGQNSHSQDMSTIEAKDFQTLSNSNVDESVAARNLAKGYDRNLSIERENKGNSNSNKAEIFDGSFGRKKREESTLDWPRNPNFQIQSHALFRENDNQGTIEERSSRFNYGKETFERKFGNNGPSGRANKNSRLSQREFMGIGSGIPLITYERSSTYNQPGESVKDGYRSRESKSIPRESIALDHLDKPSNDVENQNSNFSELVKKSEQRRTYSTSPYGGLRSNITSTYRNIELSTKFKSSLNNEKFNELSKTESNFQNRFRSPLDDLYKQHQNKSQSILIEQNDDNVDDQFKQCQELLQRAKDRRLNMRTPGDKVEQPQVSSNEIYTSKRSSKQSDSVVDVPDMKALQTRYEYLMDTIKEKESEGTRTENSLSKSEKERKCQSAIINTKTIKWKKGGDKTAVGIKRDHSPVSEYNSRSLRVPKPPQSANQKSNITQTYDWLMKKHENSVSYTNDSNVNQSGMNEYKHHVISFGHIHNSGSIESLNNHNGIKGNRYPSRGKSPLIENEKPISGSIQQNKYRQDLSQYSRDQSKNSNERSFYKPMSPDLNFNNMANLDRMRYDQDNQVGGVSDHRQLQQENSLDREKLSVPSTFEYQQRVFGSQPQTDKKFQIERRNYEQINLNNNNSSSGNPDYATKLYETTTAKSNPLRPKVTTNIASSSQIGQPALAYSNAPPSQYLHSTTTTIPNYSTATPNVLPIISQPAKVQITSPLPQVCGQIGKIVRQGPKQDNAKPQQPLSSFQSTTNFNGELSNTMLNLSNNPVSIPPNNQKKIVVGQGLAESNLCLDGQNSAPPYSQLIYQNMLGTQTSLDQSLKTGQSMMSPKSLSGKLVSCNTQSNVFQRLDKVQVQFRSALPNQEDHDQSLNNGYKLMFFSKYVPSYQLKQFNGEFINDLVQHIENITGQFVEYASKSGDQNAAQKDQKEGHKDMNTLDLNNEEDQGVYQDIGQHLKEKYDTSKDPNTWVPQLYADMCKARTVGVENEEKFKKEKEKNEELMKQIETLERDLITFRKDFVTMESKGQNEISQQFQMKLRQQTQIELEWMERVDALISSQRLYCDGKTPGQLPDSAYDIDTVNPQKIFSQILNKLEVLLSHQNLEKSKAKKFMETTVKQMDSRINQISDKFVKVQQKIIETCTIDEDDFLTSQQSDKGGASQRTSAAYSDTSYDYPSMKGTINMLKKIRKDRDEQERIIEQLKQIIQIQDKVYKADNLKLDASFRESIIRNIENFVTEEHKKPAKNMQLGWVAEVSDVSIFPLDLAEATDIQGISMISTQQRDQTNTTIEKRQPEVQMVTCEVQTDLNLNDRIYTSAKMYKEITIQTDPVQFKVPSQSQIDDGKSEDASISRKSSTTTERRDKQMHAFKEGLQQNMNEMLSEQLSKHLQSNLTEISTIKQENGRLIEKYKFEQKQVAKLKEDVRRKQKFESFFEKQKAKKYRNCGCQVGPSQIKYVYEDQYSSSYNQKSISNTSLAIKSSIQNQGSKRFNKENHIKYSEKNDTSNTLLRNVLKSSVPSGTMRSPEDQMAKSNTDLTSLNTQAMQLKYGMQDYSIDERTPTAIVGEFNNGTRVPSLIYNCSGDFSQSANIIDESQVAVEKERNIIMQGNGVETNQEEKQLLNYHIKKNQELHELLRTYLMKFEDGQSSSKQDTQQILSLLNPQSSEKLMDDCDTLNQRCPEIAVPIENDEQAAVSMLASSANFGNKELGKEMKSLKNSPEKKKPVANAAVESQNQYSLEFSDKTDVTKKCDFIDQYFNYKNNQKRGNEFSSQIQGQQQSMGRQQIFEHVSFKIPVGNQQSFGDGNELQAALLQNQQNRSNSSQRQIGDDFAQKMMQAKVLESPPVEQDYSKTERKQMQFEQDQKEQCLKQEDDVSDNVNVSEQIKQIEGRQIMHRGELDQAQVNMELNFQYQE